MSKYQSADLFMRFPTTPDAYDLILIDPPWRYDFSRSRTRDIENHYHTLELEDILSLPLSLIAARNSVVYLWATAPKLREALAALDAWGFTYKSQLIWDKLIIGMGHWSRVQHEPVLIATTGRMKPPSPPARFRSVFRERRTAHSKKPNCFYEMLEVMHPNARKIELFARGRRPGWDAWGNEV